MRKYVLAGRIDPNANWGVLRHTESKDPAFGFLMTLEKALRDRMDEAAMPRMDR